MSIYVGPTMIKSLDDAIAGWERCAYSCFRTLLGGVMTDLPIDGSRSWAPNLQGVVSGQKRLQSITTLSLITMRGKARQGKASTDSASSIEYLWLSIFYALLPAGALESSKKGCPSTSSAKQQSVWTLGHPTLFLRMRIATLSRDPWSLRVPPERPKILQESTAQITTSVPARSKSSIAGRGWTCPSFRRTCGSQPLLR